MASDKDPKRILIIEDNEVLGDVIDKKLVSGGFVTKLIKDGQEGLDEINRFSPDLILLDIMLPTMNGYEILEKLNETHGMGGFPPVIVISNSGQPVEITKVLNLGAKDYLVKVDFTPDEVISKVKTALNMNSSGSIGDEFHNQDFKILVVEDDGFLRDLISRKLTHEQFNLLVAADGEEGLELAINEQPSVILLDLILPGMNGFEVLEKVRESEQTKNIPIIILSNLGQESDIEKAKRMGADEFLIKSNFNIDEVVSKMKEVINRRHAQIETQPVSDEETGASVNNSLDPEAVSNPDTTHKVAPNTTPTLPTDPESSETPQASESLQKSETETSPKPSDGPKEPENPKSDVDVRSFT